MGKGKEKGSGQPAANRSKQAGMSKKTIIVLLVSLAFASVRLVEGAMIGLVMLDTLDARKARFRRARFSQRHPT